MYLHAPGELIADAHPQPAVAVGAEHLLDMSQPVVSGIASRGFQAERTEGQRQVVDYDEQPLQVDVLLVHPVSHGIAAEVHIGRGFEQKHLPPLDARLGNKSVALVFKNNIGRFCESVQYHKSSVVAGLIILVADISQSHYQILVH